MAMNRCPICGEKYSDTYKDCPFCEEEEALLEGEEIRRPKRTGRSRQFSIVTPMLIVLILIMAGLLFYLLRDNSPKDTTKDPVENNGPSLPTEEVITPEKENTGTMPESSETVEPTPTVSDYEQAMALPEAITVNNPDFTLMSAGETFPIKVTSGGNGKYTWVSQDPTKVSVDANGKVTALNSGVVNVVVTDGTVKGVAIVRVKKGVSTPIAEIPTTPSTDSSSGSSSGSSGSSSTGSSSGSSTTIPIELNREDMTLSVGESFTLNLTGFTGKLTWSVANANIATVSSNGTVKGVAQGRTTVTVNWDGGSASCVVRVK